MKIRNNEKGIAIILALIMLLVMSVMALTVSFISNTNFKAMSAHKRGQESFIAAETCIREGRKRFETIGVEQLFFELQSVFDPSLISNNSDIVIFQPISSQDDPDDDPSDWNGPMCRSGPRKWDASTSGSAKFVSVPEPTKALGRPPKNVSLASGGSGGASLIPVTFTVVGKDSQDLDKDDSNLDINTGTEIAFGLETFIPGGATNVY